MDIAHEIHNALMRLRQIFTSDEFTGHEHGLTVAPHVESAIESLQRAHGTLSPTREVAQQDAENEEKAKAEENRVLGDDTDDGA